MGDEDRAIITVTQLEFNNAEQHSTDDVCLVRLD
jgi:hypothetical protein